MVSAHAINATLSDGSKSLVEGLREEGDKVLKGCCRKGLVKVRPL